MHDLQLHIAVCEPCTEYSEWQGVQADELLAKEHKLAGTALFRQCKYQEAATLYAGDLSPMC